MGNVILLIIQLGNPQNVWNWRKTDFLINGIKLKTQT